MSATATAVAGFAGWFILLTVALACAVVFVNARKEDVPQQAEVAAA